MAGPEPTRRPVVSFRNCWTVEGRVRVGAFVRGWNPEGRPGGREREGGDFGFLAGFAGTWIGGFGGTGGFRRGLEGVFLATVM